MQSINFLINSFVDKNNRIKAVTKSGIEKIRIDKENFFVKESKEKLFYIPLFFKGKKNFLVITKNLLSCANILEFTVRRYYKPDRYNKALFDYMLISFENQKENLDFIVQRLEKSNFKDIPIFIALTEENHKNFRTKSIETNLNLYKITFPLYIKEEENIISEYKKRKIL